MPTYLFQCSNCEHESEDIEGMGGAKLRECPECGEHTYYRCLGAGGGFIMDSIKDSNGTPIWYPKDNGPYFDKSLQRTFFSKHEKAKYLKEHNLVMDGTDNRSNTKDSDSLIEGVDR